MPVEKAMTEKKRRKRGCLQGGDQMKKGSAARGVLGRKGVGKMKLEKS